MIGSLMIGLAYYAMEHVFRHISGGPFNPAIALAQVIWQVMTYTKEPGFTWSHWTGDYVAIFLIAPLLGGLMAGNFYSYIWRVEYQIPQWMEKAKAEIEEREGDHPTHTGPRFYPEKEMDKQ